MKIGLGIGLINKSTTGGVTIPPVVSSVTIPTSIVVNTPIAVSYTIVGLPTTITRTWYRGATVIATSTTSDLYTPVQADAGNASNIKCMVTATNAAGSSSADSNTVAQVLTARTGAFLTASAISDATIRGGLNTFDIGLIANSLDTKMKALYPFVGGTASTHRWNFMNAADTNAAFRLTFFGSGTHSSNGYLPNGTNAYADTFLDPSIVINDNNDGHLSYYSRTDNTGINAIEIGCSNGPTAFDMVLKFGAGNAAGACINTSDGNVFTNTARTDGFYVASQNNVNDIRNLYRNTTSLATQNVAQNLTPTSYTVFIGARNGATIGTPTFFTNRECAFASVGNGLSATDVTNLYNLTQQLQTTLGRSVGPQVVSDPDAQAFVTAANIQDQVQANAVNTLVIGMKAQGLWTKMKAVYPMVGGTATSHMYNLKDPRNLDAAYRLAFSGGWTHSSNGVLPNGTNAFANTFLNPTTSLTSSLGLSYYSRTNANTGLDQVDIGAITGLNYFYLTTQYNVTGLVNRFFGRCTSPTIAINTPNADARGYYYLGKTGNGANLFKSFKNGVLQDTQTGAGVNPSNTVYIGAANDSGSTLYYTNRECAFATISDGLTDTDATNYYNLVQTFQTTLGRQINP